MPKTEQKCVERWKKYFADYKIIRWDESNFDVHCNSYVEQAYNQKRFAYVSDYARLLALYNQGGIYLDCDCKALKSFDDLLGNYAFTGFGADNKELAACTMAFEPQNPFVKECLDSYENDAFLDENGNEQLKSINVRMTEILEKHGFIPNGKQQMVDNIVIYPMSYFCPLSMLPDTVKDCKNKDTYSMALWTGKEIRRERSLVVRLAHKTGLNKLKRRILGQ